MKKNINDKIYYADPTNIGVEFTLNGSIYYNAILEENPSPREWNPSYEFEIFLNHELAHVTQVEKIADDQYKIIFSLESEKLKNKIYSHINSGELYEMYCDMVGGKSWDGKPLPRWRDFSSDSSKELQARAWKQITDYVNQKLKITEQHARRNI